MAPLSSEAILKEKQTRDPSSITSLSLTHKALSDVSCLRDFKNLERLDLSSNNLTSLEGLQSCVNLKWLSVVQNKLQSLKGVEGLTKLTVLNAGKNKLRSMDEVKTLVNLRALILNDNEIQCLCHLDHVKDLNTLVLSRNPVRKIGGSLAKLKSITKISLSNCKLEAIDFFIKGCSELKELRLAHNDIKTLPAELAHITKLQNLDLGNNLIMHCSDLKVLSSLRSLKNLNLHGNPITENDKLVKKIRKLVPSLQIFNAKPIEKIAKDEKGNQVEDPSITTDPEIAAENKKKKKGEIKIRTEDGNSSKSKDHEKEKQLKLEKRDKNKNERGADEENDAVSSKKHNKKQSASVDAILIGKKDIEQDDGEHHTKNKNTKESGMTQSIDIDSARDNEEKGEKKRKKAKEYQDTEPLHEDANRTKNEKKSKRKAVQADLEIIDDGETPFTELLVDNTKDMVNHSGKEKDDKAARNVDAISGLVTFPRKTKKTKNQGSGSSVLQFLAPVAEVGLGGPSAWCDE